MPSAHESPAACAGTCARHPAGVPVTLPADVDRRTFLSRTLLAAAAAALGAEALAACGGGDGGAAVTGPVASGTTLRVADYPALAAVGGIAATSAGGRPIAIVRSAADTYVVLSRVCPHQGATVNVSGSSFRCPLHGAQFDAAGTWTGGQRTSNLTVYATTYDPAAGTITVS